MTSRGSTDDAVRAELAAVSGRSAQQAAAENFPVALRFLPAPARADLRRVYGYARFVDDVGDEASGDRAALLDAVEAELRTVWTGGPSPIDAVAALATLTTRVPIEPFLDLVEANRIDQRRTEYADFEDLLGYCRYSAAPVGRIVLHLADAATETNVRDSDRVCAALQVLEHCQDVGEDARAGRAYLPADDLARTGVARADLLAAQTSDAVRIVVALQVGRARDMLRDGRDLVSRLHGWARFAVAGFVAGGRATADALTTAHFDVLAHDIRPSKMRTAVIAARLVGSR